MSEEFSLKWEEDRLRQTDTDHPEKEKKKTDQSKKQYISRLSYIHLIVTLKLTYLGVYLTVHILALWTFRKEKQIYLICLQIMFYYIWN